VDRLTAGEQSAPRRRMFEARKPNVEPRPVGEIGAAPDQDHVASRPLEMDMGARILAGDPLRFARWERDLAVDRQRELERDPRATERELTKPTSERAPRRFAADPERHFNPGAAQTPDALARGAWVGILERDYEALW